LSRVKDEMHTSIEWKNIAAEPPHASLNAEQKRRLAQELMRMSRERGVN